MADETKVVKKSWHDGLKTNTVQVLQVITPIMLALGVDLPPELIAAIACGLTAAGMWFNKVGRNKLKGLKK